MIDELAPPLVVTAELPHRLRHGESIKQVRLPEALERALRDEFDLPIRAEMKAAKKAVKIGRLSSIDKKALTVHDFMAYRLDRSYAACYRVMHEVNCRLPDFA